MRDNEIGSRTTKYPTPDVAARSAYFTDPETTVSVPAKLFDRIIGALAAATYPNNPDRDRDNAHNLWAELLALRSADQSALLSQNVQDDKAGPNRTDEYGRPRCWGRIVHTVGGVHQLGRLWIVIHDHGISIVWRQIEQWRWEL